jgi:hypothetical protein
MPDLRDVLLKAGLVDEKQVQEARSLATMRDEIPLAKMRKRQSDIEEKFEAASQLNSPNRLRTEASMLLTDEPDIKLAQRLLELARKPAMRQHPDEDGEVLVLQLQTVVRGLQRAHTDGERIAALGPLDRHYRQHR